MNTRVINLVCVAVMSAVCGANLENWATEEVSTPKVELTDQERSSVIASQRTFPTTILVRIKPIGEIKAYRGEVTANADAITFITRRLCEIWLPAGQEIIYSPEKKAAVFGMEADNGVIAHELLHCLRGAWHEDKKLIESTGGRQ